MSGSPATPDSRAEYDAPYRVDLRAVLSPFVRGGADPVTCLDPDGSAWRAGLTPDGAGTLRIAATGRSVIADAWGPGARWLVESVPDLLGFGDEPSGFPEHLLPAHLQEAWGRLSTRWRVPRSRLVVESLIAAVLEQKVTGVQSRRSWRSLLVGIGEEAPGPTPRAMRIMARADSIRRVTSWQWHRWGVGPQQSGALMRALVAPGRLDECASLEVDDARRRLMSIPGVGEWTAAEVAQRALGDPDAVSFGDYHLAHHVVFAFTGRMDGTEEQMADLLEPFAGHRYRVQRLVEVSGIARPARGPRMTIADHRSR